MGKNAANQEMGKLTEKFSKKKYKWPIIIFKKCLISLAIREMQTKTTVESSGGSVSLEFQLLGGRGRQICVGKTSLLYRVSS